MCRLPFAARFAISAVGAFLVPGVATTLGQVCSIHERQKLTASDAAEEDRFGYSVSISGNWALIGAWGDGDEGNRSGSAYVFRRDGNGTPLDPTDDFWIEHTKLTASDGNEGDWFGYSVSISGDWAIVGAYLSDDAGSNSGSAYIFRRDDAATPMDPSDDFWVEEAKLTASDAAAEDRFAIDVSIDGGWAVVGTTTDDACPSDPDCKSGAAYVFRHDDNGTPFNPSDDLWIEASKLTASDAAAGDVLGASVSISGGSVIVGAIGGDDGGDQSGSAYVFRLDDNGTPSDASDDLWVEEAKLTASDAAGKDYFGGAVSISGGRLIVGARGDDGVGSNSGSAYVFRRDDAGTPSDPNDDSWVEMQKLTALDASGGDQFGSSVSISGKRAVVGASTDDDAGTSSGSAYVYRLDNAGTPLNQSDDSWVHQAKYIASDGDEHDLFGESVSISGDRAIVGAFIDDDGGNNSGSAYILAVRVDGKEDCNCNLVADTIDIVTGTSEDCTENSIPDECEPDCNENDRADSCDIADLTSSDCNTNDIPDDCERDCNNNAIADDCDVADGTSADCNINGIPDECEPDCNENGVADSCDITGGTSDDCNSNAIPDDCERDCNGNGIPDDCDIASATSDDCSNNGIPDECEPDCNTNGVADSCDIYMGIDSDCNDNGIPDECDIAAWTSNDEDGDGVPDECAEIRWRPVAADGYLVCLPGEDPCGETEIMLSSGSGVVTLVMEMTGWDRDRDGDPLLGSYQGTVDATTYSGGLAPGEVPGHPGNPGTLPGFDLTPPSRFPDERRDAFIAVKVCGPMSCASDPTGPECNASWDPSSRCGMTTGSWSCPWWRPVCIDRPDYVFSGLDYVAGVSTATPDFVWFAASPDCAYDDGTFKYGGTLRLKVPHGATGTYNVGLLDDPTFTMMNNCLGPPIRDLKLTYGQITMVKGRCCSNIGVGTTVCEDDLSKSECYARSWPREFAALESCSGVDVADCNENGIPDECEPFAGDCDRNGIPDDCEPDADGDGVINQCDSCPLDPNKVEPGLCGCGVDDGADNDGDSVSDCVDICPGLDDAIFAPGCGDVIPTSSVWGLLILGLSLLAAGKVYFGRLRADA